MTTGVGNKGRATIDQDSIIFKISKGRVQEDVGREKNET